MTMIIPYSSLRLAIGIPMGSLRSPRINFNILHSFRQMIKNDRQWSCCHLSTTSVAGDGGASSGLNFELNEHQQQFKEIVRRFAKEEIIPTAAHYDKTGEFAWPIVKKARDLGIMNTNIPKEYGGPDLGLLDTCIIAEEICYGCSAMGSTLKNSELACAPVIMFASEQIKKKYLSRLIYETGPDERPLLPSYAVTEPSGGSDVAGVKTRAKLHENGSSYLLNGNKMWITNAGHANWFFVLARTHPDVRAKPAEAFSCFVVDADSPGLTVGKKELNMGQRAADSRAITFEDVLVPKENLIGEEGKGFKMAMLAFDKTRPMVAAMSVGVAQRALNEATRYSMERKSFGTAIGNHQAIQFMLADMAAGIETSRLAYLKAAWLFDRNQRNTYWASIAKCLAADVANKAATDAVQILGGYGYNSEYPVEKLMRDAKLLQIYEGTAQIQRLIIARQHFDAFK